MNCFVVSIDDEDTPYFLLTGLSNGKLKGLTWDGSSYSTGHEIPIDQVDDGNLRITHYYGLSEITFKGIVSFAWHHWTKIIYAKIRAYRFLDATTQYFFNKKKLVTKKRMDLLRFMMEDQLDRGQEGISILSLMTKMYSMRLFLHPSWEAQEQKVKLYLDSLVHSEEVRLEGDKYVVTGAAILTLEKYEEEERRHTAAVKMQHRMFWLSLIALLFAIAQTGLIRVPTIWDFS